jgi:hypothetical protein
LFGKTEKLLKDFKYFADEVKIFSLDNAFLNFIANSVPDIDFVSVKHGQVKVSITGVDSIADRLFNFTTQSL